MNKKLGKQRSISDIPNYLIKAKQNLPLDKIQTSISLIRQLMFETFVETGLDMATSPLSIGYISYNNLEFGIMIENLDLVKVLEVIHLFAGKYRTNSLLLHYGVKLEQLAYLKIMPSDFHDLNYLLGDLNKKENDNGKTAPLS